MFTGIIETTGQIYRLIREESNLNIWVASPISHLLKIDQSVSHNGVCLTVIDLEEGLHCVTAIHETLQKSNFSHLKTQDLVNLERCMPANGRFDGHIVQGHVDQIATVQSIRDADGSWIFTFQYNPSTGNITVEKGSITINGVSLTVFDSKNDSFSVAIIPYTYEHTNFKKLIVGDSVNLEFDIIGKYVAKILERQP